MNNLLIRAASGAVFVALMIGCIWHSYWATGVLFTLLVAVGLLEFFNLSNHLPKVKSSKYVGVILGTYAFVTAFLFVGGIIHYYWVVVSLVLLIIVLLSEMFRNEEEPLMNVALLVFGLLYVVVPFYVMLILRGTELDSMRWLYLVGMFILIWTNDSFAYLTGRFFGKTKLFERISLKKTWEGTIGGIVFSVLAGFLIAYFMEDDHVFWMFSAVFVSLGAIFGDLFESMLKRNAGIKDSGNIMPGHGGVLDRFDAALFGAPIFYLWMQFYI
jgi:phosphatidate cytidylyltransferase